MAVQSQNREESLKEKQISMDAYIDMLVDTGNKYYSFVKEHSRYWTPQKRPREYRAGKMKECFKNAFDLAIDDDRLIYVEGIAFSMIPTEHAWVVDKYGRVVDNTWKNSAECVYFGIPFNIEYVAETIVDRGYYGVIMDWKRGFPLMKGDHGGPDRWKHKDHQ